MIKQYFKKWADNNAKEFIKVKDAFWCKILVLVTPTPSVKFKNTYIDIIIQPTNKYCKTAKC